MKRTVTHYITCVQWSWQDEPDYCLYPFKMTGEQYATIGTMDIEIEVPDDFDPRNQQIAAL